MSPGSPSIGTPSLGLAITNPLILYRALLSTNKIKPDPAQHRLALQLQQLYFRLKDYSPEIDYRYRLERAARVTRRRQSGTSPSSSTADSSTATVRQANSTSAPIRHHDLPEERRKAVFNDRPFSRLFNNSAVAVTRTIPIPDSAMTITSPRGMLLYGEVGRGKSMLIDLLYDALPTTKKRRWHFNTFILDIFRRLELARIERLADEDAVSEFGTSHHDHVVLSLARETMEESPILFLDEFQLPDRVAGKLINGFLMSFFHLGGVLVASSNRMPEELAKAQGVEFAGMETNSRRESGGVGRMWERIMRERFNEGQKAARSDFGIFVEVLKKRCDVWEMEGQRDWRRDDDEAEDDLTRREKELEIDEKISGSPPAVQPQQNVFTDTKEESQMSTTSSIPSTSSQQSSDTPSHYHITPSHDPLSFSPAYLSDLQSLNPSNQWVPSTLTVYARSLTLLTTSSNAGGIALLPFPSICATNLGPADYISICSTFPTIVIPSIPVLTLLQKNEARRFITLLDACYEARCRLLICAAAPPDRLFFPETRTRSGSVGSALGDGNENGDNRGDSIDSEAFSEMYQDSTAPFRPNVSVYDTNTGTLEDRSASPTMSIYRNDLRSVLADEDADFGPTYGNGRGHGTSDNSKYSNDASNNAATWNGAPPGFEELERRQGPDFTQTGALTGEDERFAYKRARSRLWEMCGRNWWRKREGKDPSEWWTPVRREGRFWEKERNISALLDEDVLNEVRRSSTDGSGGRVEVDGSHDGGRRRADSGLNKKNKKQEGDNEGIFRHGASPFRTSSEPPPTFGWQHAWGMMKWGKKAGEWGKGVEGDRAREKDQSSNMEKEVKSG